MLFLILTGLEQFASLFVRITFKDSKLNNEKAIELTITPILTFFKNIKNCVSSWMTQTNRCKYGLSWNFITLKPQPLLFSNRTQILHLGSSYLILSFLVIHELYDKYKNEFLFLLKMLGEMVLEMVVELDKLISKHYKICTHVCKRHHSICS